MTNLFSIFDPSTSLKMNINWMSLTLGLMLIPKWYWMMTSRSLNLMMKPLNKLNNEFKMMMMKKSTNKGSTLMFISLFVMVMLNNSMGLYPYVFTSTSHLMITLAMTMPMWMSFMLMGWLNNSKKMMTHLVPMNTPSLLMPLMVCIETISNIIRPMTLSVRLTANMISGHLILTLLGNTNTELKMTMLPLMIMVQSTLMILEMMVATIQSYVIATLSTLYSSEVN
uniref:ATP synthase F0 subunit 6 n=1 Tax=Pulchriphyllium bioculatum TaxID=58609 RepID=UPI0025A96B4F|nr:ATP synthase F0 subunit 6 [Pulchriphyllium bioculatum]WID87098.1 ATP synthase F0 subunit 6 [Pulchriphyllium bioculatum]